MGFRVITFVMAIVFAVAVWPIYAVFADLEQIELKQTELKQTELNLTELNLTELKQAEWKQSFAQIIRLADDERKPAYLKMTFQPDGWTAGKVIHKKPYSVIVSADSLGADGVIAYQLQIWRGIAARVEDDLLTEWDLLELDSSGKVIRVTEGYERALQGYFKAPSQNDFRTVEDVQRYPWANLPTDSEAKAAHIPLIPKDGSIDVYGILPREGSVAISNLADKVKPLLAIPAQILDKPPTWWQSSPDIDLEPAVPTDITSHWAKDFIIDLMKKSIIVGYEDQTIHPNSILTKAEFTAMLVRGLDLDLIDGSDESAAGFTDVLGHWAKHEVDIALESELIIAEPLYDPDAPISRLETVRILARAFQTMQVAYKQAAPMGIGATIPNSSFATVVPTWNDLQSVSQEDVDIITLLAAEGIISGDSDSKFRPDDSLTRAEASKVLSLFLKLK
jgi:hypothetical protein